MEEARKSLDDTHNTLAARLKELAKQAEDRASHRRDIKHYEEKIPGLQAAAAKGPKEQQKLEENQKKLEDVSGGACAPCWGLGCLRWGVICDCRQVGREALPPPLCPLHALSPPRARSLAEQGKV